MAKAQAVETQVAESVVETIESLRIRIKESTDHNEQHDLIYKLAELEAAAQSVE
jgi:hypothetical protein